MTWGDIKLATIQKMFSSYGSTIKNDQSTMDYLAAMPYAANEAIYMLATAGKFLVKNFSIAVQPIDNLLTKTESDTIHSKVNGELTFEVENCHSIYFEVTGRCTLSIIVGELEVATNDFDSLNAYIPYRKIIENTTDKVTLVFSSTKPYAVKNVAMYEAIYDIDSEVPEYAERIRYSVPDILSQTEEGNDFYSINSIYFEGEEERYIKTSDVYQEGDKVLVFDRDIPGNYVIYYNALPVEIVEGTPDDYVLPLDKEVEALLPLYMASQIYKEDDIAIATQYRNEFEVGFERLKNSVPSGVAEKLTSESGWI